MPMSARETTSFVRDAIASLPPREQKVIGLYYYSEATMKQIGAEIGVNESRVSQLHARAIRRLRDALAGVMPQAEAAKALVLAFQKPKMAKSELESHSRTSNGESMPGVVVNYPTISRTARSNAANRKGFGPERHGLPGRKHAVLSPASSVTKIARRSSEGVAGAIAR